MFDPMRYEATLGAPDVDSWDELDDYYNCMADADEDAYRASRED